MHRSMIKVLFGAFSGVLLGTWGASSLAAGGNDQEARNLRQQAIMNDYLAMHFDAAVEKLEKALDLCAGDQCSPSLVARLHRDLGVVYVAGLEDIEEGKAEFIAALTIDPSLALDKDLTTDKVSGVFEEVKAAIVEQRTAAKKEEEAKRAAVAPGDIIHRPPPEALVQTPLPIYAELKKGIKAQKLKVRWKTDTGDWESVEMKPLESGFGVLLPCKNIGGSPREVEYYIQAYEGEDVVASMGSRTNTLKTQTKIKLSGPPPSLPGQSPPGQCTDACPPGTPGCGSKQGTECIETEDCEGGLVCTNKVCAKQLELNQQAGKRSWASLAVQQDFMLFPAEDKICSGGNSYKCYWGDGTYYGGLPDDFGPRPGNKISATGFAPATLRVLLGFDYLLTPHVSVGGRLGFAFSGAPKEFIPVHVEGRLAYWFIQRSLMPGFRPYALVSGGLAQVDGHLSVKVTQTSNQGTQYPNGTYQYPQFADASGSLTDPQGNLYARKLAAWRKSGPVFASLGLGAMYEITKSIGAYVELKAAYMLPNQAVTMAGQVGASYGF